MIAILLCTILLAVGYDLISKGKMDKLLDRLRLNSDEEQTEEPAPPKEKIVVKKVLCRDRHVTIFPKQKKGRAGKYYPEETKRLVCDLVTYENGILICHLKDSCLEEEFPIKDIDRFII